MYAPIIIFCYNRPNHLKLTIQSLINCTEAMESDLFIFSDGAKNEQDKKLVNEVREIIQSIQGFKKLTYFFSDSNKGLADSVISGVSKILEEFEQVIVMEDDMICTNDYLKFMNDALHFYQKDYSIFSISGYLYPIQIPKSYTKDVLVLPRASSFGWGTWKNRWQKCDWKVSDFSSFIKNRFEKNKFCRGGDDLLPMLIKQQRGEISSWAIRWTYCHYKNNAFCLHPVVSKIQNIGTDGSGTNFRNKTDKYKVLYSEKKIHLESNILMNAKIVKSLRKKYSPSIARRVINLLKYSII